jgi:ABC-type polysaccharide/polyol phosphate export permease
MHNRAAVLDSHAVESAAPAPEARPVGEPACESTPEPTFEAGGDGSSIMGSLREIITDLWTRRDLLYQVALRDIRLRYKQAVMGFGWAVLMPLLIVLSGAVVRFALASYSGRPLGSADVATVAVKGLGWAFFVGSIGFATASVVANQILVSKVYFPREVLPLAAVLTQALDSGVGGVALAAVLPFLGVRPSLALLWAPVLLVLLFLLTAAAALVLSCANLFFRDVKYLVQVGLTFGIFFTPVLFEPIMFGRLGATIMMLNPIAPLLEGLRLSIVGGHNLLLPVTVLSAAGERVLVWSPWYLAYAALWSIGGVVGGSLFFHRLEFIFAEYV